VKKGVSDQADGLRHLMANSPGRLVAVVGSGPAVGATSVALNLAAALVQQGKDILLLDERRGPEPTHAQRQGCLLLVDTVLDPMGALSPLAAQADNIVVVLQPSAASIKASYACIKKLQYAHALQRVRVLVNRVTDAAQAQTILANLMNAGSRYLALTLEPAGCVRSDPRLAQARRLNMTVVEAFQTSPAAIDFRQIATELLDWPWRAQRDLAPSAIAEMTPGHETEPVLELH
jgi:flagellar biosynthesis protein FlhG